MKTNLTETNTGALGQPGQPGWLLWNRATRGIMAAAALAVFAATPQLSAETNTASTPALANRYLLIVETSRTMKSRSEGTVRAVRDLLNNSLRKQLHAGDSIGLWTYNSELYAGQFPLQAWSAGEHQQITDKLVGFLQAQKNEKAPKFEKVLPALKRVVGFSRFITVILVTSGEEDIQGTPLDNALNQHFKSWRKQQQEARMPVVTVLCAENRQFTEYSVTPAPFAVEMPPLAKDLVAAREKAARKLVTAQAAPPPRAVAPLIFTGKKSPRPAAAKTDTAVVTAAAVATNALAETTVAAVPAGFAAASGSNAPAATTAVQPPSGPQTTVATATPVPPPSAPAAEPAPSQSAAELPRAALVTPAAASTSSESPAPSKPDPSCTELAGPVSSSPAAPSLVEPAATASPLLSWKILVLSGLLLLAVAAGLWLVLRNPAKPHEQISLITRSFEQTRH